MTKLDWTGGDILVIREIAGWGVIHRLKNDQGEFGLDFNISKIGAIRFARKMAQERKARLLIED